MWSEKEIQILFDNPDMSIKDLAALLPGRSEGSIKSKRSRLKIKAGSERGQQPWTHTERLILQENYGNKEKLLELLPERSWDSIRSQAHWLRQRGWKL